MPKLQIFSEMGEFTYLGELFDEASLAATETSSTSFVLTDANGSKFAFAGSDFTYDGTTPSGGTITSVNILDSDGDLVAAYIDGNYKFSALGAQNLQSVHSIATFLNKGNDAVLGSEVGDDIFAGFNPGNDKIRGLEGDDFIKAWSGDNRYDGGSGFDTLTYQETFYFPESVKKGIVLNVVKGTVQNGWGGTDEFRNFEEYRGSHLADTFIGSKAAFEQFFGFGGADIINGGKGVDRVRYDRDDQFGGDNGIAADLSKGRIVDGLGKTDKVSGVEEVTGTASDDTFIGNEKANKFRGLDGLDSFNGKSGLDTVTLFASDSDHGAIIDLSLTSGQIIDDGFGNTETATSIESVEGTFFNDTIKLGNANDASAWGDDGNDTIVGGEGKLQFLEGGEGNDIFAFLTASSIGLTSTGGRDIIGDFAQGEDGVDLSGIDDFSFIGTNAFNGVAGELRYSVSGGVTIAEGDVNGDGAADFELEFSGSYTLIAADFGL